jgi:phage terminase large subunit-like protein
MLFILTLFFGAVEADFQMTNVLFPVREPWIFARQIGNLRRSQILPGKNGCRVDSEPASHKTMKSSAN